MDPLDGKDGQEAEMRCKSSWSVTATVSFDLYLSFFFFFSGKSTQKQETFHGLSSVGSHSCNRSKTGRVREAFWKLKPPSAQQLSTADSFSCKHGEMRKFPL